MSAWRAQPHTGIYVSIDRTNICGQLIQGSRVYHITDILFRPLKHGESHQVMPKYMLFETKGIYIVHVVEKGHRFGLDW